MADRVTTLHKISEFRPQVHMQTLCLKHFIPHSRNYYRAVPKRKWTRQFQQERRVGRFFSQPIQILPSYVLNTSRAICIFGFQAQAHAFTDCSSSPEVNLWMASFTTLNICCGVLSSTGIEQICFLLLPLSLMAQALCCL